MESKIKDIAAQFEISGDIISCKECKAGHINSTYFVSFKNGAETTKYVLQKINTYVFKNPDALMGNIVGVTEYLRKIISAEGGDPERGTLHFVKCHNGRYYYRDADENCWRMYRYIDNVISYQFAESAEIFEKAGHAFGDFQGKLAAYDASSLIETIPDFHNTKKRYEKLAKIAQSCSSGREITAAAEIEFIHAHKEKCTFIVDNIKNGNIPLRVTHNDTKLNNILIDKTTGKTVCIIDLDTVMPGSALYDFGDAIRFGASSTLEDEPDLDKVFFRADMFKAYARGYINGTKGSLCEFELKSLTMGAYILTLETGIRFLTDYLEGDVYFRTEYENHNLIRARNQLKLVYDIETRFAEFSNIIDTLI